MNLQNEQIFFITKYAYIPIKIQDQWIWRKNYFLKYKHHKKEHGCNDCCNPLSPCGGKEFDEWDELLSETLLEENK